MTQTNTSTMFSRVGGEFNSSAASTRNAQAEFRPDTVTTDTSHISISAAEFDHIVTYFQKKGISESLARTYGVALIEVSKATGQAIDTLIDFNNFSETDLSGVTMATINRLRNKTAQIGYITKSDDLHQTQIKRTIK